MTTSTDASAPDPGGVVQPDPRSGTEAQYQAQYRFVQPASLHSR